MARSRSIGGIYAELSLKDAKFRKGMKAAGMRLQSFAGTAVQAGAVVGAAITAAMVAGSKHAITLGADLDHLSTQTGVNVAALMKLQQAYKDSGKSADSLGKDIGKMQSAIYDAAQSPGGMDPFTQMGISAASLMAMSPEDQFFAIGNALKDVENQTKRNALAMDVFGRSGAELMTVFQGSDLEDVTGSLGKMPEIMEEFSGAMERADTLMGRLPNKADQFFAGFTSGIIGQVLPGLETVDDFDFTKIGRNLGDSLNEAFQPFTDGSFWEIFEAQGKLAIAKLQQGGGDGSGSLLNAWAAGINASMDWAFVGGEWGENFDKYAVAGIEANNEIVDDLGKQVAELMKRNAERAKARQGAAASIGMSEGPLLGPSLPPIEVPEFNVDRVTVNEPEKTWEESAYDVNSMQARGLAQGGVYRDKEQVKQTSLLERMAKVLEAAEINGELAWR